MARPRDMGNRVLTRKLMQRQVHSVQWAPAEALLCSGDFEGQLRVWSTRGSGLEPVAVAASGGSAMRALQFDESRLVSASWDGLLLSWDRPRLPAPSPTSPPTLRLRARQLCKYSNLVYCMRFDETRIVFGAHDGNVLVLELTNGDTSSLDLELD